MNTAVPLHQRKQKGNYYHSLKGIIVMEERFYLCNTCGNVLFTAVASGIVPHCCGKQMLELKPNVQEGSEEHHLPTVEYLGDWGIQVKVGKEPHPMTCEHSIKFVCVKTTLGYIIRYLNCDESPSVTIHCDGTPVAVYAYCNIHGLWRIDL